MTNIKFVRDCSNFTHVAQSKNMQWPKFEVSNSKNKKIGATISFPEDLEDTPFKLFATLSI